VVHDQPQADLASGRVRGVEALVRWPHPTRGIIPPDGFIPVTTTRFIRYGLAHDARIAHGRILHSLGQRIT